MRNRISPRFGAGMPLQAGKARLAAATAASTSAGPEEGNSPMTSSWFAGLTLVKVSPESAPFQSAPIRFWYVVVTKGDLLRGRALQRAGWLDSILVADRARRPDSRPPRDIRH